MRDIFGGHCPYNNQIMKLSIIIPIYNVEAYIEECLVSVFGTSNNYNEFEVILINDGSTDKSIDIAKSICKDKDNVHIVEQTNQGLSVARMQGLSTAKGEYVWFIDSDDWLEKDAIDYLLNVINNSTDIDAFVTPFRWNDVPNHKIDIDLNNVPHGKMVARDYLRSGYQSVGAPHYIIRKDLFLSSTLYFPHGLLHEDVYFGKVLLYIAKFIAVIERPLYNYRIRSGSIMTSKTIRSSYDLIANYNLLYGFYKQYVAQEDRRWYLRNIIEGTLLESININAALIGKPVFSTFYRHHFFLVLQGYIRCGANRPISRLVGDLSFIVWPAMYTSIHGEHRYISLHEERKQ